MATESVTECQETKASFLRKGNIFLLTFFSIDDLLTL
jgi:hypothetical protein